MEVQEVLQEVIDYLNNNNDFTNFLNWSEEINGNDKINLSRDIEYHLDNI